MKNIILVIGLIIGLELSLCAQSFKNAIWERPLQTLIVDTDTLFINDTAGFNLFTGFFDLSNDTLSILYEAGTLFSCISSDTGVYEIDIALDTLRIDEIVDACTGRRNELDTSIFEFFAAQGICTFT